MINWLQKIAMFVFGEGDHVVAYQSSVFLINPNYMDTNDPIVRKMANFLGTETRDLVRKYSDTWEYLSSLRELRPDILQGYTDGRILTLQSEDFQHGSGSRLLQNVIKTLGIQNVQYENEENTYRNMGREQIQGNLPEHMYHGTTSQYADQILRFGLQADKSPTNYPGGGEHADISHLDIVFLSEDINRAVYHALNAVGQQEGFPVVFKFEIPNSNLLVSDYDVEIMSDNKFDTNIYDNTYKAPTDDSSTRINEDPFGFSKKIGIMGYRGRIPANFIVDIMIRPDDNKESYNYSNEEWVSVSVEELSAALEFDDPSMYSYEPEEFNDEDEYVDNANYATSGKNWLLKLADLSNWLRSQGVSEEILRYSLDPQKFPKKMQKWVALQLHKKNKENPDIAMINTLNDLDHEFIEVRDWFNYMSRRENGFNINKYDLKQALEDIPKWQEAMAEERGEGHPRWYTQPVTEGENLGNGFRMVEVVPDDLKNEGAIMQHCCGDDEQDYIEKVERGSSKIFSLRDAKNWPHATIEVENETESDIDAFENDPENGIYDDVGNLVDINYDAYGDRSDSWIIAQIQGKQNEPPIDKYRPFLKFWMKSNPQFNPSKNDILSVTSNPELLQMILAKPSDAFTYDKVSQFLDEEHMMELINSIIENPQGWSQTALSDALSEPIIKEWPIDREKHKALILQLANHEDPDMRRAAYSRMASDPYYRTEQGLEEFKQIALNETSANVIAAILPNFFTYPNRDSTNSMEKYRNPLFTPDLFPFAIELSEKFKGIPGSNELHDKIVQGLASQGDAQTISFAVTNRFIGQRLGEGSTYELRYALENMDDSKFGQVWSNLDPMLRMFLLSEDAKGYKFLVSKHRNIIDQYPEESSRQLSNGGLAPPGHGTIYQPESIQDVPVNPDPTQQALDRSTEQGFNNYMGASPGFPDREASSWLSKVASIELMYHGTSDALAGKIMSEGLAPGRDLVWDSQRSENDQRSRESYGGIYFTNNFMTAWGAARTATEQFGGRRLMTISQLELRSDSLLQDEDQQNDPLGTFNKVLGINANDYFYMQWAENDFYNLDQITDKYIDEISLNPRSGEPKPGFEDPRQREALIPYVTDFIKASVMREIAIAVEQEQGSQFPSLKYKYPQFENVKLSEAESNYRQTANALMEKTRFMTNNVKRFMHNVRSMEPISFKGRNKVVLIARIHEDIYDFDAKTTSYIDGKYNDTAEILYATNSEAIQMLIKDMQNHLGGGIRVRDTQGRVYLDQPRKL